MTLSKIDNNAIIETKEILTDKERKYLTELCKPYDVVSICRKYADVKSLSRIEICVRLSIRDIFPNGKIVFGFDTIHLPYFETDTMYKGMNADVEYTLDELNINTNTNNYEQWTCNNSKDILTDSEKRYITNVCKPYRVLSIAKNKSGYDKNYILISVLYPIKKYRTSVQEILLPNFKANTMYKKMKLYKKYTLDELGIEEE